MQRMIDLEWEQYLFELKCHKLSCMAQMSTMIIAVTRVNSQEDGMLNKLVPH